jgi:hypothetical protein
MLKANLIDAEAALLKRGSAATAKKIPGRRDGSRLVSDKYRRRLPD